VGCAFAWSRRGAVVGVLVVPAKDWSKPGCCVHRERVDPPLSAEQTGTLQQMAPALTEEDITSEVGLLQSQDLLEKVVVACGLEDRVHPSILSSIFHMRKQTPRERRCPAGEKSRPGLPAERKNKAFFYFCPVLHL